MLNDEINGERPRSGERPQPSPQVDLGPHYQKESRREVMGRVLIERAKMLGDKMTDDAFANFLARNGVYLFLAVFALITGAIFLVAALFE